MKTSITGYLLFKKNLKLNTKYTKALQAGEIPESISADVLYLLDRTSQATGRMIQKRKGDYLLRSGNKLFQTSLFLWDSSKTPYLATGDIRGTQTLLIIFLNPGEQFEIFIAPGMKNERGVFVKQIQEGKFSKELKILRKLAALNSRYNFNDSLNFDFTIPELDLTIPDIDISSDLDEWLKLDIPDPLADLRAPLSYSPVKRKQKRKRASKSQKQQRGKGENSQSL